LYNLIETQWAEITEAFPLCCIITKQACTQLESHCHPASLDLLILLVEEKRVFFSRLAFALCFVHQLLELQAEMLTGQ